MPGPVTHLIVADQLLKVLPEGYITKKDQFYAGALAPDAIHARKDMIRADKKKVHLRLDIPDMFFHLDENQAIYKKRMKSFIEKYIDNEIENKDLHLGYLVHLLTDELFVLSIRMDFSNKLAKEGIHQKDKEFFDRITRDLKRNEHYLFSWYDSMDEIKEVLNHISPYEIRGLITAEETTNSRHWVIREYLIDKELIEPIDIPYSCFHTFINEAVDCIKGRLTNSEGLCATL